MSDCSVSSSQSLQTALVLVGGDPARFRRSGGDDSEVPRLPLSYSFVGALQKRGVRVSIRSIGRVAQDRKSARPAGWWTPYLSLVSALPQIPKYDVVISWGTQGALLAALAAIHPRQSRRIAIISFANFHRGQGRIASGIRQLVYRWGVRQCGRILFMTHRQMDEAITQIGCNETRVAHLPVGVDTRFFAPGPSYAESSVRSELREMADHRYVLVAGDQLRDEDDILRVLQGLNTGLVRLTQNKHTELFWRRWAQHNTSSFPVLCIAHLRPQEVRYAYQQALCLLSLVDSSWQPAGWTVMTEAMACGLPVIVNRGLTTEEMRIHTTPEDPLPFLEVEGLDPLEARGSIQQLLESAGKRQRIGLFARQFVEKHFDIEKTTESGYGILCDMVAEYRR